MRKRLPVFLFLVACGSLLVGVQAQLSTNPYKFLGNITTTYNMDTDGFIFSDLWNQVTPENETKWSSIEGNRGSFNWGGADNAYNYAKRKGFPFKFHTLIWGSQYPSWMDGLNKKDQYDEIIRWMDAIKDHYPDLELIDVVNEAVPGHAPAPYREALGGDGVTGYDWIIKAFELAYERWPNAILIYNDYNTFQWQRSQFIQLVQTLIDAGAPIDAYGCQSHDLTDMNVNDFKSAMKEIQDALQLPMYSTEYDIGTADDNLQLQRYKEQIPYMWEADYCAGITLWGFIYGKTWVTDGNSGIIRDGVDRPAMTWLREYMASDKAKNAKFRDNFPLSDGHTKEASVYVTPSTVKAQKGDTVHVNVRARMRTKTIEKIEFYVNNKLTKTMTEAPYLVDYYAQSEGTVAFKALVYTTDGSVYTRTARTTVYPPRKPYRDTVAEIPGVIQAENFDTGADGLAFHDSDTNDQGGTGYRADRTGVDIVRGNGGYVLGYTSAGEWLEYTVDVKTPGAYLFRVWASAGVANSGFTLSLNDNGELTEFARISVPQTGNNSWDVYKTIDGKCSVEFTEGRHIIRLTITGSSCNIDRFELIPFEITDRVKLDLSIEPDVIFSGDQVTVKADATVLPDTIQTDGGTKIETVSVSYVDFYLDGQSIGRKTAPPFQVTISSVNGSGQHVLSAVATDSKRRESVKFDKTFNVIKSRTPYGRISSATGVLQFENFDRQGEGFSFHDSDDVDEGGYCYRNDNEGVDVFAGGSGYYVGSTVAGEWLEYIFNVKASQEYFINSFVLSAVENSSFNISLIDNGEMKSLADVSVPRTEDGRFATVTQDIGFLEEGDYILRITITGGGCNLDKMEFRKGTTPVSAILEQAAVTYQVYSMTGVSVGQFTASDSDSLTGEVSRVTGRKGIYLVKNLATGKTERVVVM